MKEKKLYLISGAVFFVLKVGTLVLQTFEKKDYEFHVAGEDFFPKAWVNLFFFVNFDVLKG